MINQLKAAYTNYTLVKVAAFIGVLLGGALLYKLFGGFPPLAWKLLAQALFHISTLWAIGGTGILIPLLGLVLLSTALLIIWGILVVLATRIIQHLWYDLHAHQQFAMDLREAEYLAEQNFMDEDFVADDAWLLDRAPALGGAPRRSEEGMGLINPARGHGRAPALSDQEERFNSSGLDQESDEAHAPTQYIMRNQPTRPAPRPDLIATMPQMQSYNVPRSRVVGGRIPDPPTPPSGPINRAPADGSRGAYQPVERRVHIPMDNPMQESVRTQSRDLQAASEQRVQTAPSRVAARPQLRLVPTLEDYLEDDLDHLNAPDSLDNLPISPANSTTLDEPELDIAQRATAPGRDEEDDDMDITTPTTLPKRNTNYDTMPFTEPLVPEEPLRLVVGIGLDPGIARKNDPNEDNLFAIQGTRMTKGGPTPVGLFVVADGMGGHANGQEASRLAIHAISDVVVPALLHNMSRLSSPTNRTASEDTLFRDLLKDGVHRANLAIYRRNREMPDMMGTTLTAALVVNTTAYIANVGDSRTYHYHAPDGLKQITRDHSIVARLVEDGVISPEDIYTHPKRNQIYRALGDSSTVDVDCFTVSLQSDDILMLCSDGLWEMVRDNDMEQIIASSARHPSQISSMLVQAALARGGADNISVIIIGLAQTPAS